MSTRESFLSSLFAAGALAAVGIVLIALSMFSPLLVGRLFHWSG